MSDWGIIKHQGDILIKIRDDFPMEDDEEPEGVVITLKEEQAEKFAKDILKEVENGN